MKDAFCNQKKRSSLRKGMEAVIAEVLYRLLQWLLSRKEKALSVDKSVRDIICSGFGDGRSRSDSHYNWDSAESLLSISTEKD